MTLDQIRIFCAVADRAHVTRAAEALGMTQSAASSAIAALEARYGVALFDRIGRRIALTRAGRDFLPHARALLDAAAAATGALAASAGAASGTVAVAASQTIANYWLPRRLAAFHAAYPRVRLDIAIANTRAVARAVADGAADLGLVEGPVDHPDLMRRSVASDRPVFVGSAGAELPLTPDGRPNIAALAWVARERGSGTRALLDALARRAGLDPAALDIVLTLPSNEAVREAVEAGAGATVISAQVVAEAIAAGRLTALPVDLPPRDFALLRRVAHAPTPAETALAERLSAGYGSTGSAEGRMR